MIIIANAGTVMSLIFPDPNFRGFGKNNICGFQV